MSTEAKVKAAIEQVDYTPGEDEKRDFYVTAIDGNSYRLLVGPFDTHEEAELYVEPARTRAVLVDLKAWFYSFGTCSMPKGEAPPHVPLFSRDDLTVESA